jgi:hypothetical protein
MEVIEDIQQNDLFNFDKEFLFAKHFLLMV